MFRCGRPHAEWISRALRTTGPENLQRLSLELPHHTTIEDGMLGTVRQEWLDLDRLLVESWASHPLRLVIHAPGKGENGLWHYVEMFLPELARGGIVDLVPTAAR